ncbi:MAG TPA: sigma-70 family RNA polymerase sigma factor [Chthonomonadaceae bacterium]|nr:sigma-70 family RNA polymerase sigma factor [Chthonomonadaceae bacterium]
MENSLFPQTSDEELVLGALLGNLKAFDALVRRFRGAVVFVAQQALGSREMAEDIAQEAFLLAYKALPQLQDPSKFAGWLYAITRNRAQRVRAREQRSEPVEASQLDCLILAHSPALVAHPAEECEQNSERAFLAKALEQLPSDYQIALRLRYYEEWPVARIAEFLMLSTTTVKWRLHYGRELLRRQLTQSRESHPDERLQSQQCGNEADLSYAP